MNKAYFYSYCTVQDISPLLGAKIIDGRYKPYLSALDDQYYSGDIWTAKLNALQSAIKTWDIDIVKDKLSNR